MSRSDAYALGQTLLLTAFAAVFFFVPGPLLFVSRTVLRTGTILCAAALLLLMVSIVTLRRVIQVAPAPKEAGTWWWRASIAGCATRSTPRW